MDQDKNASALIKERDMKLFFSIVLLSFSFSAFSMPAFLNKFKKAYPKATAISQCKLCHADEDDRSIRNDFGKDYANNNFDFKAIEGFDSDADGFTNIAEINAGTWPGDRDSHPRINQAPTGEIVASIIAGTFPLTVDFTSLHVADVDGKVASIVWTFSDDKTTVTADKATHTFQTAGSFEVSMSITDNEGAVTVKKVTITVSAPVPPPAPTPAPAPETPSVPTPGPELPPVPPTL